VIIREVISAIFVGIMDFITEHFSHSCIQSSSTNIYKHINKYYMPTLIPTNGGFIRFNSTSIQQLVIKLIALLSIHVGQTA